MSEGGGDSEGGKSRRQFTDSAWSGETGVGSLQRLEYARAFAVRALSKVINDVLAPFNAESTKTLEVGSGTGYLRSLLPGWKGSWTQLEPTEALLTRARESARPRSKDQFVVGSAYELPFEDNTHDLVVGLASYDVMVHLDEAIAETLRVLKPGGTFLHLFDFRAPADPVMALLKEAGISYEFTEAKNEQTPSVLMVDTRNAAHQSVLDLLVFEGGMKKGKRKVNMNATFEKSVLRSLQKHGFNIIFSGQKSASVTGPMLPVQRQFPKAIKFTLQGGAVDASIDDDKVIPLQLPGLPGTSGNTVEEEAIIDVIIAEKPK